MENQPDRGLAVSEQSSIVADMGAEPWFKKLAFVVASWFLSRLLILIVMQWVAPMLSLPPDPQGITPLGYPLDLTPKPGWELFTHWDGKWYEMIATKGYEYGPDYATKRYSIGFPPLFSLVSYGVMQVSRLPFAVVGPLVNNITFLGAMYLLYLWSEQQYGTKVAKWATIVLSWCPYSLFGTVAYTEGVFLLTTISSLRAFDKKQYFWASFWGSLATTARFFGTALIPTFLIVAWREKRSSIAYLSALGVGIGWLIFLAYCGWKFGDALAPFRAQIPWTTKQETWKGIVGNLLFRNYFSLDQVIKFVMFFGGGWLFWHLRKRLNLLTLTYAFCYLGTLFVSLSTAEISRYSYHNVALSIAFGFFLAIHRRWRILALTLFIVKMIEITIRFAWWHFPA